MKVKVEINQLNCNKKSPQKSPQNKNSPEMLSYQGYFTIGGGEKGIRTPGPITVNGFQDRRIRPLCHLSGCKTKLINFIELFFL